MPTIHCYLKREVYEWVVKQNLLNPSKAVQKAVYDAYKKDTGKEAANA